MLHFTPGDRVEVEGQGQGVVASTFDADGIEFLEVEIGRRVVFVAAAAARSTPDDVLRRLRT